MALQVKKDEEKFPQTEVMHYDKLLNKLDKYVHGLEHSSDRFVNFSDRTTASCWGADVLECLYKGECKTTWKGVKVLKLATVLHTYQDILQKLKPKTIIEFGTFNGGSALWLSDMCKLFSLNDTKIISVDITHQNLLQRTREMTEDNTEFIQGDVLKIKDVITPERLRRLPHPWFVMDDSHVHVDKVLLDINEYMQAGDYYVIEDCHPDMVTSLDIIADNKPYEVSTFDGIWSMYRELENAMRQIGDEFKVDTYYCDYFGHNTTVNMNAYLRKI